MPPWLPQFAFAGLVTLVLWFVARTMVNIDKNQAEMFTRLQQVEKDLYELRGEHRACAVRRNGQ